MNSSNLTFLQVPPFPFSLLLTNPKSVSRPKRMEHSFKTDQYRYYSTIILYAMAIITEWRTAGYHDTEQNTMVQINLYQVSRISEDHYTRYSRLREIHDSRRIDASIERS
jgi:hypothetical protein